MLVESIPKVGITTAFGHWNNKSPRFFAIVTGEEGAALCVCPGCRKIVFYLRTVESTCKELLLQEITIPSDPVLIGHRYLQSTSGAQQGRHCLLYYSYLILEHLKRLNANSFAYGNG